MAATSVTTGVTAPGTETKSKKNRSPINQAGLRKLATAESIGKAAQREMALLIRSEL